MNKQPKIIFVDGFNAVGKDYAIANMCKHLQDKGYNPIIGDPRYFLPKVMASKRYFTFKLFDKDVIEAITNGHINALLDYMDKLIAASVNSVLVVNRSYMSTMMYNHVADSSTDDYVSQIDQFLHDTRLFMQAYKRVIQDTPAVLMMLSKHYDKPDATLEESISLLKAKITARDGITQFDDIYLEYLVKGYQTSPWVFEDLNIPITHCHSGQTQEFVDALFQTLPTQQPE